MATPQPSDANIGWQPPSHQVESSQAPAPQAQCETATGSDPFANRPPAFVRGVLTFAAFLPFDKIARTSRLFTVFTKRALD
jgi:hypothetical protein